MSFSYFVLQNHRTMHRLGLQYIAVRYGGNIIPDAVIFDNGTSSESEANGSVPFTTSEFLQSFDVCLPKESFLSVCAEHGYNADYITSANIGGWEISRDDGVFEEVKVMGDRTANVADYYIKLVTLGQY